MCPDSKVHGANMGPSEADKTHGGGPHVGPMNFAIWVVIVSTGRCGFLRRDAFYHYQQIQ